MAKKRAKVTRKTTRSSVSVSKVAQRRKPVVYDFIDGQLVERNNK